MTSLTWERHQEHAGEYDVTRLGYNYRLDEMRAAIGLVQLGKLRENNQRRTEAAGMLREALENLDIPGLAIPFSKPRGVPVHHIFVILLPEGADRGAFRRKMSERGIQTSLHYPLPHRFAFAREVFADPDKLNLPVVESLASRLVTLPMGPHLTGESVRSIAEAVGKALGRL
jgi:dTDP-4-amino-4,6-dideoxygalactose transaminase